MRKLNKKNVKVVKNPEIEKFRVVGDSLVEMKISRDFMIELENGEIITINKWIYETHNEAESDWDVIAGRGEYYNKMSEEDQDALYDFIQKLSVIK